MILKGDNERTIMLKHLKYCIQQDEFFKGKNTELVASTQTYSYQLDMDEYHGILIDYADDAKHYISENTRTKMKNGIIKGLNAIRLTKHFTNNYCEDKFYIFRIEILASYITKELIL